MGDSTSQSRDELKQQECSFCWEEIAVIVDDGEPTCEDCYHAIHRTDALEASLKAYLQPHLKDWIGGNLNQDEDLLECALVYVFEHMRNEEARELIEAARNRC